MSAHSVSGSSVDAATQAAVSQFAKSVREAFPVHAIVLFGSRARGDFKPDSDADVAVFFQDDSGSPEIASETRFRLYDLAYQVFLDTDIFVAPIEFWKQDWSSPSSTSSRGLLENIDRDGVSF